MIVREILQHPRTFHRCFDWFNDYDDTKHWVRNNPRIPFWMKWYLQVKLDRGRKQWLAELTKRTLEWVERRRKAIDEFKGITQKFTTGKDTNAN